MRLFDRVYQRLEFCRKAVSVEYKRSNWYKAMSIIAPLYVVFGLIVTFTNPIPSWSWRTRIIVLLSSFVFLLLLVVEALYRSATQLEKRNLPTIEVKVPAAFVRPILDNRSVCQVFVYAEIHNHTPYETTIPQSWLTFKVKEKDSVVANRTLNLNDFEICSLSYEFDEEHGDDYVEYRDCESIQLIPLGNSLREGIPLVGWTGFTIRNSVLPYTSYEQGTGRTWGYFDEETGDYIEQEETETVYVPQFRAIEQIALNVMDGFRQPWKGIAEKINPKGEGVRARPKAVSS